MTEKSKISYFEKKDLICPVCDHHFKREKMLTGSGRFISKLVNDDLRRVYKPNQTYGMIYPLIYNITVCSECYYASIPETFLTLIDSEKIQIKKNKEIRKKTAVEIFGKIDYSIKRTLISGTASYFLAITCYSDRKNNPILFLQKGICALRCSWCCDDLSETDQSSSSNWEELSKHFKFLANRCFQKLIVLLNKDDYHLDSNFFIGPDLDFNYDFEGVLYLASYLGFYYKDYIQNKKELLETMEKYSTNLSRIFGRGKYSSSKPAIFLRKSQELYNKIKEMTESL